MRKHSQVQPGTREHANALRVERSSGTSRLEGLGWPTRYVLPLSAQLFAPQWGANTPIGSLRTQCPWARSRRSTTGRRSELEHKRIDSTTATSTCTQQYRNCWHNCLLELLTPTSVSSSKHLWQQLLYYWVHVLVAVTVARPVHTLLSLRACAVV